MARLEVACRRFGLLSGIRQEPGNYTTCVLPRGAMGQRKGLLAIVTEPAGDHPALASEACRLAQEEIIRHFYTGEFFSLTSGLLKALDAANSTLLGYNYGDEERPGGSGGSPVAVQAGGIRTRRAQAGLTAVLLKSDGAGVYIAQMAPTQAYLVHNGVLTALPEPQGWQARPGKLAVKLRRVPNPSEAENEEEDDLNEEAPKPGTVPALPLGSGASVDVDLIFRRVEEGDLVVVVSSSLSRLLDRSLAEEIFSTPDPDYIVDALFQVAAEAGVAEAHACVLQLGTEVTSGVDTEIFAPALTPLRTPGTQQWAAEAQDEKGTALPNVLKGPREWFARRKQAPDQDEQTAVAFAGQLLAQEPAQETTFEAPEQAGFVEPWQRQSEDQQEQPDGHLLPTQVLLQRSIELPPYLAAEHSQEEPQQQPSVPADTGEELEFDGWEDSPPVLVGRAGKFGQPAPAPPWSNGTAALELTGAATQADDSTQDQAGGAPRLYSVPKLFDDQEEEAEGLLSFPVTKAAPRAQTAATNTAAKSLRSLPGRFQTANLGRQVGDGARWAKSALVSLLPERQIGPARRPLTSLSRKVQLPGGLSSGAPILIAIGLVILLGLLAFSVFRGTSSAKHNESATLLTQAKQEETLGNQPTLSPAERLQHLQAALTKAQEAIAAEPQSADANLLATTVQNEIDGLQGITRVQTSLLFDLDKADTTDAQSGSDTESAAQADASSTVTTTGELAGIILQSNEAYVLDKQAGKVFKCRVSSKDCSTMLKTGDNAGGQKVGSLTAMTLRVGNLAVVDSNLAVFLYSADTGSWQGQQMGGADGLQKPGEIASYDGNLYLLGSKQGQISKYLADHYGEPPDGWIKDQATSDQLNGAVSFAIDGAIYALLPDGKIMIMQGGKVERTLTPKIDRASGAASALYTNTDLQNLYVLQGESGTVTRISKEGQTIATMRSADRSITRLSGITVDEGRGKMYLLGGHRVYEASLTAGKSEVAPVPAANTQQGSEQPAAKPTAEP